MFGDINLAPVITVLAAVLVFLVVRNWARLGRKKCDPAVEVVIINACASLLAHDRGATVMGAREFLLAAMANPSVAASLERAGLTRAAVREQLAAEETDEHEAGDAEGEREVQAIAWDPELRESFTHAAEQALKRRETEFALTDVLTAIRDKVRGEVGLLLRNAGVDFDDTLVATALEDDDEATQAFVYIYNDDVSPQPKVTKVLHDVFELADQDAVYTMLTVHYRGRAALGPYAKELADQLIERAAELARELSMEELVVSGEAPDTSEWRMNPAHGLLP
jgi:ATP-dependent Clp protease adapter protein ClpS